jgi:hypothetical protein
MLKLLELQTPYEVRIDKKKDLKGFYWKFLESVSKALSKEGGSSNN